MELSAGFVLNAAGVRTVKRAEARAPSANAVTMWFVRSSICRIFLRTSRGIMGNLLFWPIQHLIETTVFNVGKAQRLGIENKISPSNTTKPHFHK